MIFFIFGCIIFDIIIIINIIYLFNIHTSTIVFFSFYVIEFFIDGFRSAIHRAPNMNTLVALGSTVAFTWSVFVFYHMCGSVYLSLGDKEERTRNPVMATVGDRIRAAYVLLQKQDVKCILEWKKGNHFKDADLRTAKAFTWLMNE